MNVPQVAAFPHVVLSLLCMVLSAQEKDRQPSLSFRLGREKRGWIEGQEANLKMEGGSRREEKRGQPSVREALHTTVRLKRRRRHSRPEGSELAHGPPSSAPVHREHKQGRGSTAPHARLGDGTHGAWKPTTLMVFGPV